MTFKTPVQSRTLTFPLMTVGHEGSSGLSISCTLAWGFPGPLLLLPVTSTTEYCFCFGSIPSFFGVSISRSILGTYRPGAFLFQCPIILPFHTVHGVVQARILKWFAIPFSSGPHSVRPLHHDPPLLGGPTRHGLVSLS